jgi:hypothetical protein
MRSTHLTVCRSIWFVSISRVIAAQGLLFVIISAGLVLLSIHLTADIEATGYAVGFRGKSRSCIPNTSNSVFVRYITR